MCGFKATVLGLLELYSLCLKQNSFCNIKFEHSRYGVTVSISIRDGSSLFKL